MVVVDTLGNMNTAHNNLTNTDVITEAYQIFWSPNISTFQEGIAGLVNNTSKDDGGDGVSCKMFLLYFNLLVVGSFCIIGLTGNTLSLLVLRQEQGNRTAVLLLQALAVVDNFFLLFAFITVSILTGLVPFVAGIRVMDVYRPYVYKYVNPLGYVAWTANVWITVLLAINR